jgi:four helix bundle protein
MVVEKEKVRGYKDLLVWQKGIQLAKEIYRITQTFPNEEKFGLVSQRRRTAVSIPSNIAEGQARHTRNEFVQFVSHAEGSVAELDTQLILAGTGLLLRSAGHRRLWPAF